MAIKKKILNILLTFVNAIVLVFPIKKNRITFVSLESKELESDLKLIYNQLHKINTYDLRCVLIKYDKKNIWNNFLYMLNTIKQIWNINRSILVIINDNNYVISNFKRQGVKVLQVWHATGAIKKFGNAIKREYPIQNYDYVIANSEYWREPYSEAFGVDKKAIQVVGMPRVDHLFDKAYIESTKKHLLHANPILKDKKIILYAPTFRGNIYKGFTDIKIDYDKIVEQLGEDYILIYKLHPLLKNTTSTTHERVIGMFGEETHDLFTISDYLISDFSSIIFDYSLLNKPMLFFVPDLEEYTSDLGYFIDYKEVMPGPICISEKEIIENIQNLSTSNGKDFRNTFFQHQDGHNLDRVVAFIKEVIHNT